MRIFLRKVGDIEVVYPTGHYALRAYNGPKLVYTRVKGGATEALAALKLAQKRANAVAMAENAGIQVGGGSDADSIARCGPKVRPGSARSGVERGSRDV
jgi:hypothetical protein